MTIANILRELGRIGRAKPAPLDASILRDIGLSRMAVDFDALRGSIAKAPSARLRSAT